MHTLYLVGTPIGNLEDITMRALRILGEVGFIAAEDTRTTGRLLHHYKIDKQMISFHEYSDGKRVEALMARLAAADIALVSDAGMPTISDPGYRLVQAALAAGHKVVPIPGPTAAVTALSASGLPTDSFLFYGFLPRKTGARRKNLAELADLSHTLIFYASPHRVVAVMADMQAVFGERPVCVGRELTKMYEEFWRGTLSGAQAAFTERKPRGEFTLVVGGKIVSAEPWSEAAVIEALQAALAAGSSRKDAATEVARRADWRKRKVYALVSTL